MDDLERLSQVSTIKYFERDVKIDEMLIVYLSDETQNYNIKCALIPCNQKKKVLSYPSWNWDETGLPGVITKYKKGKSRSKYLRYGNDKGMEPLVIERNFSLPDIKPGYQEINEEFRLFHNLYHDKSEERESYYKIDEDGNECKVAVVEQNCVKIRCKEIRQFLAIKEMFLSIQFDYREYSKYSLKELGLIKNIYEQKNDFIYWQCNFGDYNFQSFSRLLGKRLIFPLPKEKSGFEGFAEDSNKKYAEFIIDVDENGEEVTYSCNPIALDDFNSQSQERPNYLTPVYFNKKVLDKYYQQPSKYSIEDSMLFCQNLWSIPIDNHHDDKVCVWLGDLGENLSYKEQIHWLSENIPPKGEVSKTFFNRQIGAKPTNSERAEHLFIKSYNELQQVCDECLKWQIFNPLSEGDKHHFQRLRIPSTNEQCDFDELILSLTKILIDSLNQEKLKELIPKEQRKDIKGSINILQSVFEACNINDFYDHISFLRDLQELRSTGSAHRKGSEYYKKIAKKFGCETKSLISIFSEIITQALSFLEYMITVVQSEKLKIKNS